VSVILYQLLRSPMTSPDVSLLVACDTRLIIDWISQAGLFTSYGIGWVFWYLQCCRVSLALARLPWYWLDLNVLQAIIITRSHAMYQRSRKILTFLIVSFLAVNIFDGFVAVFITMHASGGTLNCGWQKKVHGAYWWIPEEYVLSSTYQCSISFPGEGPRLDSITWILGTVWEVLTLCLAVWIAVKHFLELWQHSTGKIMENCFAVLIKNHVLYFAR